MIGSVVGGPDGSYLLLSFVVVAVVVCVSGVVSDFGGGALELDFLDHGLVLIGPAAVFVVFAEAALDGQATEWHSHAVIVSNVLDLCFDADVLADPISVSSLVSISLTAVAVCPRFVLAVAYGLVDSVSQVSELYQMPQKKELHACFLR